ncbi:hypothetical protein Vafri_6539, partial [Volvox africanus]
FIKECQRQPGYFTSYGVRPDSSKAFGQAGSFTDAIQQCNSNTRCIGVDRKGRMYSGFFPLNLTYSEYSPNYGCWYTKKSAYIWPVLPPPPPASPPPPLGPPTATAPSPPPASPPPPLPP